MAQKRAEYLDGIARLWPEREQWPELADYFEVIATLNESDLRFYPGSPEIARHLLREQDKLLLMELHNQEIDILRRHMGSDSRTAIHHRDGFEGLLALLPPTPRRGLVLMDPPYELKEDYQQVVQTLKKPIKNGPPASMRSGIHPGSGDRPQPHHARAVQTCRLPLGAGRRAGGGRPA
jgi:23S rRNA (adenine2030-N6)-methyltransferase